MGLARYFRAMGYDGTDTVQNRQMNNAACALLTGKANMWMNRLEIMGEAPQKF